MNRATTTRRLLLCGAVAGPLFVLVFLIEGATRADYSSLRHPVSSLAIGDLGWVQTVNFLITGSLVVAFAIGLHLDVSQGRERHERSRFSRRALGDVYAPRSGATEIADCRSSRR